MRLVTAVLAAVLLGGVQSAIAATCTLPQETHVLSQQVLQEVNALRVQHGLAALHWDDRLTHAAQLKACELARTRKFAHDARDVKRRIRAADCRFRGPLAENLGHGYLSAQMAARRWLASEEHRVNMMHPRVRATGFAWMPEPQGGGYWVMMYAGSC